MPPPDRVVVTEAFAYAGGFFARRLLDLGVSVKS